MKQKKTTGATRRQHVEDQDKYKEKKEEEPPSWGKTVRAARASLP